MISERFLFLKINHTRVYLHAKVTIESKEVKIPMLVDYWSDLDVLHELIFVFDASL